MMEVYDLRGDHRRALAYADSARAASLHILKAVPADAQRHVILGLQLAYLGRKAEAIAEGQRGLALIPITRDAVVGAYYQQIMARIYMMTGEPEKAMDMLEPLLKMPYFLSPAWLRIDPTWNALRNNTRFQRLVAET
jgi:tetratricopeptide (TPR) repeat protein